MTKHILMIVATALLTSCASVGKLEPSVQAPGPGETIFIIGLQPDYARVTISPGSVTNGTFKQSPTKFNVFVGHADDGFIVGKASATDSLALSTIEIAPNRNAPLGSGRTYMPCDSSKKAFVFSPQGGKVVYLGDFNYTLNGNALEFKHTHDFQKAKAYIDANYSNLKGKLESQETGLEMLPTMYTCPTGTIYIPIVVPRGR